MRFSTSGFFHKSVGPRPLIHILKLFRIWPRFRGVISESVFFSCHFPDHKSGKWSLSGYCYPESDHFPDSNNRKVNTFRLLLSGKWTPIFFFVSLSGYYYPASLHFPDSNNRKVTLKWIISFFPYLHCLFVGKKEFEHFSWNLHVLYTEIFTLKAYNSAKKQQMTEIF